MGLANRRRNQLLQASPLPTWGGFGETCGDRVFCFGVARQKKPAAAGGERAGGARRLVPGGADGVGYGIC